MRTVIFLTFAALVSAHSRVTHFHVNGQASTGCVREATGSGGGTDPIKDLASKDMACNVLRGNAKEKCTVKAGDEVGFEYRSEPNTPPAQVRKNEDGENIGVTDVSHKGPCAIYAKKVDDSLTAEGAGSGWFKVWEDGVDASGKFCTTRLNEANSAMKAKIPSSLKNGDYILRAEMLTLNNADPKGEKEPQFYPGCVQVTVSGGSGTADTSGIEVSIPGYLTKESPGVMFNIWNTDTYSSSEYTIPGPKVLGGSGSGGNGNAPSAAPSAAPNTPATTSATVATTASSGGSPTSFPAEGGEGEGQGEGEEEEGEGDVELPSGVIPPTFSTGTAVVVPPYPTGTGPSTLLTVLPTGGPLPTGYTKHWKNYYRKHWRHVHKPSRPRTTRRY